MFFLKKILLDLASQIRSILITASNLFSKRETRMYPEEKLKLSPRYRGRIILTRDSKGRERCVACNLCSVVCPVGCISLQKSETKEGRWYSKFFRINFSRCIFCGLCEEACPTAAIQLIPDIELSEYERKNLVYEKEDLLISGPGKYPNYDFYKRTGVNVKINQGYESKNKCINVDVKKLLP